jgi:hypothetical protein
MVSGHATVQMMHKTPSLWRRAKMPWIFGHAKQIQNQHPSLCAPWSFHVDRHLNILERAKLEHEIMAKIVHPLSSA